jgi:CheY-like chemotaxis protein
MKILLVEDSKFLRLATERAMVRAGYEVTSAGDGEEGLRLAREKLPDLILLDMLLPKLSGPDVLKALKLDPTTAAIPVVVMSGLSQKNAARLEKDGAFAFLEKSDLALDQGPEPLLVKLESFKKQLAAAAAAGRK